MSSSISILNIRERLLILLLRNDCKTQQEIADFLDCSLRKVAYWCTHGNSSNLDSLINKRMQKNFYKATNQYVDLLLEIIEKEPQELEYKFRRWTNEHLAIYLE